MYLCKDEYPVGAWRLVYLADNLHLINVYSGSDEKDMISVRNPDDGK